MGSKPKTLLYFIMQFRVGNDLHVVICTWKPCISSNMLDGRNFNFYKLATYFMLLKFKKHIELFTETHNRKTLQYEHIIEHKALHHKLLTGAAESEVMPFAFGFTSSLALTKTLHLHCLVDCIRNTHNCNEL